MQIYKKQGLNETQNEFFCPQRQNFTRGIPKFLVVTSKIQLQHLECYICHNIVWKAVACSQPSCFASCCQACIAAYQDSQGQKKCPKCKQIFNKTSIPLMNNILSQILLKCPNYTNCDLKIQYDSYLKHSLICDYRRVQCQGCRQFFTQKNIKEHTQKCGDILIKCEKCNLKLPQLDYKQIHSEVNCLQRMLEQKCAFLDKMEQKMDQLQQKLESYENMFGKIVRGQSLPLKIEFYTSFPSNFIFGQNEVRLNRSSYNSIKQKYDFLHFYVTYPIKTQAPIGFHWRVQIMTLQGNLLIGICSSLSVNSVDFVINRFGQIKKKEHNENKYKLIRKSQLSFSRGDIISFKYLALRKQLRIQNQTKNVECKLQSKICIVFTLWIPFTILSDFCDRLQLHLDLKKTININLLRFLLSLKSFDSIHFDYNFRQQTDKSQEIISEITMFSTTSHSLPNRQSLSNYEAPFSPKCNFTAFYNQPINQNVDFSYPSSSTLKREKKISRQEMEQMKKDVESLQNKMKNIINQTSAGNANSTQSSLQNSNINLFDENLKKSQLLKNSNATTFFPVTSLKSSILASKIAEKQTTLQGINLSQTHNIEDITSFHKLVSRGTLGTSHSINSQKNMSQSMNQQSYQHFDREIGYEKQIMELKSKITTIQFEKDNLQRTLDRTQKRVENRDQQIIRMKQRIFLLEETKNQIDEKEKNWKQIISKLEKELIEARIFKNDPNFEAIFQNKASETNTIRQQLRRKKQQVEHLEERVNEDQKKFEKMISAFNSERLELITKVKQTERRTSTLIFQKEQEIATLKQELQNFRYNQARNSKANLNQLEKEPLKERIQNY